MAATFWMRRAWLLSAAASLTFPSLAGAGEIRGTLVVPAAQAAARLNPYPGQAGSLPGTSSRGGTVADAVVFVDKLPASVHVPEPKPRTPELVQSGQSFVPRVLAVQKGALVAFPNHDPIYHNVFSVSPTKRFDLGKYARGRSRSVRFDKAGLVNVYCDIHSDMAAFVYVIPHHVFAQPDADGRFTLPSLPSGTYSVRAWHPDFGDLRREVQVPAHGDAVVDLRY